MPTPATTAPKGELKMWLVIREDLPLSRGKLAVQAGHAFMGLTLRALVNRPIVTLRYLFSGARPKIALSVKELDDFGWIRLMCEGCELPCYTVRDAGRTEIQAMTQTVIAFGPAYRDDLPSNLRRLRLCKD